MILEIFEDGLFAAIAAIGFAAISRPPKRAYLFCALLAAAGHSLRFIIMSADVSGESHIIVATNLASFAVGALAVFFSPVAKVPAETCLFPALLPMIPGVYAYKSFGGVAMCLLSSGQAGYQYYFYQFSYNGMMCMFILVGMVLGATVPIFLFKKISFQATRYL